MDPKDLEIARLKGQVEALEKQIARLAPQAFNPFMVAPYVPTPIPFIHPTYVPVPSAPWWREPMYGAGTICGTVAGTH